MGRAEEVDSLGNAIGWESWSCGSPIGPTILLDGVDEGLVMTVCSSALTWAGVRSLVISASWVSTLTSSSVPVWTRVLVVLSSTAEARYCFCCW